MTNKNTERLSIIDINLLCQDYLNIIYEDYWVKYPPNPRNNIMLTYGEILYESVNKLINEMVLSEKDIFIDLGSGAGKVPAQVFLMSAVQEAIGIEILADLHQQARLVKEKIQQEAPCFFSSGRQLNFIQGDFLTVPWSATVIFLNSVCYSQKFLHALGEVINKNHGVRLVLTLRPIPNLQHLSFKKFCRIECTWDSAICYMYGL